MVFFFGKAYPLLGLDRHMVSMEPKTSILTFSLLGVSKDFIGYPKTIVTSPTRI